MAQSMRRGRNRGFGGWSRSFEAWTEVLGSERLTGALLDRLTHRVHILEANGESFRLREAKTRQKRSRVTPAKTS